jgi:hypothetical protein
MRVAGRLPGFQAGSTVAWISQPSVVRLPLQSAKPRASRYVYAPGTGGRQYIVLEQVRPHPPQLVTSDAARVERVRSIVADARSGPRHGRSQDGRGRRGAPFSIRVSKRVSQFAETTLGKVKGSVFTFT